MPAPEASADENAEFAIRLPEPGRLAVKYDIDGGAAETTLLLQMLHRDEPTWRGIGNVREPAVANKGEVTLDNLPPGKYDLTRRKSKGDYAMSGLDRRTIEIEPGKTTRSDFVHDARRRGRRPRGGPQGRDAYRSCHARCGGSQCGP